MARPFLHQQAERRVEHCPVTWQCYQRSKGLYGPGYARFVMDCRHIKIDTVQQCDEFRELTRGHPHQP